MITREATKEVLEQLLKSGQLQSAIDDDGDYVYITVSIFNAGSFANVLSCDYDEESEAEAASGNDLFISKDDCLQLLTDYELDIETEYED